MLFRSVHAAEVGRILEAEGYDAAAVTRVQQIVRKENLARDPEVQALEDALCLVFLEIQFHDVAARLDRAKMVDVTRKTLRKMSPRARELASAMELGAEDRAIIEQALEGKA